MQINLRKKVFALRCDPTKNLYIKYRFTVTIYLSISSTDIIPLKLCQNRHANDNSVDNVPVNDDDDEEDEED